MVQEVRGLDSDENDDTDTLNRFFSMICKFNGGRPINTQLKEKLEKYFEYRWAHDRNFALGINNEQDREMLDQLPEDVQIKIYKFLFSEFLFKFRDFFTFFKHQSREIGQSRKFRTDLVTWQDTEYQEFMKTIMMHLEPRHNLWQETLYLELDLVHEIIFFQSGSVDLGFEINKKKLFKLRFRNQFVVGAHEVSFDRRSMFIYKASTECNGFQIRKIYWRETLENFPALAIPIKTKILNDYYMKIRKPMMLQKRRDLKNLQGDNSSFKQVEISPNDYYDILM